MTAEIHLRDGESHTIKGETSLEVSGEWVLITTPRDVDRAYPSSRVEYVESRTF